ncbi:hypothetical protein QFC22_005108 [Naganishia vaughanmartiniae]|uniref:Uncharacterized protein n=1 Tax=Naganishia vaughanmartiniae TaxID=1424756 RepID=A0ACC2WXT5_9TREE|nr:hypothetical protein QFC22_005108 [Naganishia vaughanmartiniae]
MTQFTKPKENATVFHIDMDVMKERMSMFYLPAQVRVQADVATVLKQMLRGVERHGNESFTDIEVLHRRITQHRMLLDKVAQRDLQAASRLGSVDDIDLSQFLTALRQCLPENNLVLNESISNYPAVWKYIAPTRPGCEFPSQSGRHGRGLTPAAALITSGGSSLGWALGAAVGAALAGQADLKYAKDLITVIVGDGSYIFGIPSAAFWMARRYDTPFLTIVLNNGGYKSPRLSMLGVYPDGQGSSSSAGSLNISFDPQPPNYGLIAEAAGGAWWKQVKETSESVVAIQEGIDMVRNQRRCAVIEVVLPKF